MPNKSSLVRTLIATGLLTLVTGVISSATPSDASDATTVRADWPSASAVTRGAKVAVKGTVDGNARRVMLQHQTNNGWQTLRRTWSSDTGSYRLRIPTGWETVHRLRVRVPATSVHPAATSPTLKTLTVKPRYHARGSRRAHSLMKWRLNPCAPVRYRINKRLAPAHGVKDVKRAFRLTARATGLRFKYVGTSSQIPWKGVRSGESAAQQVRNADLLFGWATPKQVPALGGNTAGIGGPSSGFGQDRKRFVHTTDAMVAIRAGVDKGARRWGRGWSRGELYMHEIGHALGLGHTNRRGQVLNQTLSLGKDRWGAGDLTALRKVGRSAGCFGGTAARSVVTFPPAPMK